MYYDSSCDVIDQYDVGRAFAYHLYLGGAAHVLTTKKKRVKASHTRHRALGPELIPVYRQSACR